MLPPPIQVPNRGFFDREQKGGAELFVVSIISIVRKRFMEKDGDFDASIRF